MIDLYELFQTEETSTQEDIKKKYRELCFKYHPDKNNGDDETFKRIQSAYEILSNPILRSKYDMRRRVHHITSFNFTDEDYELLYMYYRKLRESNEYKLLELLYKSLPKHLKDYIRNKIKVQKHKQKQDELYKAPKWIDITDLMDNQTIHLYVSMTDAYNKRLKVIYLKTVYGIYYLFMKDFNTSYRFYNGSCYLTMKLYTRNWKQFYRKYDHLYCLVKEKDKFIILPDDTIVYNTRSVIKGKGFTPNGDIVFVTYF